MKKSLSIILFGILFFLATTQCGNLPFDIDDDPEIEYTSESGIDDLTTDVSFYETTQFIDEQNVTKIDEILKRSVRDLASDQQRFRQEMLQAHNEHRARHCAPALILDNNLNYGAQQYAEYLVRINRLQHSGASGLGENLAMRFSSGRITNYSGRDPTNSWYNEVRQYNYNQGGFSFATGHFTQLVWKSSQKLGVGVAYNSARTRVYVVARYSPPGNYANRYRENVLPPRC